MVPSNTLVTWIFAWEKAPNGAALYDELPWYNIQNWANLANPSNGSKNKNNMTMKTYIMIYHLC